MELINKLFKSRDYPKIEDRTVGSYYSFYMGGSSAGKAIVNREGSILFKFVNGQEVKV